MSAQETNNIEIIKEHVKSYEGFPKPGILFW